MRNIKSKRGFTLIELLAVIAILAILLIIAIPSVIKLYNNAKINTFVDEVQSVINTAEKQYMADQMNTEGVPTCYSNETIEGVICSTLDLSGNKNLKYYIGFKDGKISKVIVNNGTNSVVVDDPNGKVEASSVTSKSVKAKGEEGYTEINADTIGEGSSQLTLYSIMKNNALTTAIDFKVNSKTSGTNGIYTTTETDSGSPVYYYRGSYEVLNNNLIFNNFCWKIIRTTETGGVKIIYNGTPTDGKCETQTGDLTQIGTCQFNANNNDNAYVGYMYGSPGSSTYNATHANTNPSTIKTYIDEWYATNFTDEITAKLEDTVFCNDRSTKAYDANTIGSTSCSSYGDLGYGTNKTLYGVAHRASYYSNNPAPTLKCAQANDKFTVSSTNGNGKLTYPVGLITLDELVFAGFNTYYSNTSNYQDTTNYLYTNQYYWTLSPVNLDTTGNALVGLVYNVGNLNDYYVNDSNGVRPAVSLADGTLVESSGDGSKTNPYVVK